MSQLLTQFENYLAGRGLRLTGQRQLIAATFFTITDHVSTEELYRSVQAKMPSIGYVTVYRTLKLLAEAGLASEKNFKDGFARFEKAGRKNDHHDHLICTACNRIIEFRNPRIESLQDEVAQEHGFLVADHNLEIYGLCSHCRKSIN